MISTELAFAAAGFAVGCALLAVISAARAVKYARSAESFAVDALDYLKTNNEKSLSLAQLAEVQAGLTELTDSYQSLLTSHKKLRSRIGMREVRDRRANGNAPDDSADYATRKSQLRDMAKSKGYL